MCNLPDNRLLGEYTLYSIIHTVFSGICKVRHSLQAVGGLSVTGINPFFYFTALNPSQFYQCHPFHSVKDSGNLQVLSSPLGCDKVFLFICVFISTCLFFFFLLHAVYKTEPFENRILDEEQIWVCGVVARHIDKCLAYQQYCIEHASFTGLRKWLLKCILQLWNVKMKHTIPVSLSSADMCAPVYMPLHGVLPHTHPFQEDC